MGDIQTKMSELCEAPEKLLPKRILGIKHSGQLGDIVYSLPAARQLMEKAYCTHLIYFIPSDTAIDPKSKVNHFGGALMVTQSMFEFIRPLLLHIDYVYDVIFLPRERIPGGVVDLDIFRNYGSNTAAGSIPGYFFKSLEMPRYDHGPWITLKQKASHKDSGILLARSTRYLNNSIDYTLLGQFAVNTRFMGTEREYHMFHNRYPGLNATHLQVSDALDAARAINSCSLFIGNQSVFFSIAEGLQAIRLLESFEPVPNVVSHGGIHGSFLSTNGLLRMSAELLGKELSKTQTHTSAPEYLLSI